MDHGRVIMQGSSDDLSAYGAADFKSLLQKHIELVDDEVNDIVDMRFVSRVRSGSVISACSINSQKTVRSV